jgi:hypothetical protein
VGRHRLGHRPAFLLLQVAAVAHHVVEHPPRLVLGDLEAGEREEPLPFAAGLGHAGVHAQPDALACGDELQLVDVEAELVQPLDPLGDAVALFVGAEDLLAGELVPQRVVPIG